MSSANSLLNHKAARWIFILLSVIAIWRVASTSHIWFEERHFFLERPEPRTRDDDAAYYFIGEHFWGIPHDGKYVKLEGEYPKLMEAYPIRGVGLGALVVKFQRTFQENWRVMYTRFAIVLNVIGVLVLALGMAAFTGSILLFTPLFIWLINKFSLYITYPTAWCTELLSRGLFPMAIGIAFLLANLKMKRWIFGLLAVIFVLINVYLVQMKVQWLLGLGLMTALLLLLKDTRKTGYVFLAAVICSALSIRAINYFKYNGNKELFASNGYMALRWDMEGAEILRIGCEEKRFPPAVAESVCARDIREITYSLLDAKASFEEKAKFLEICSKINMELTFKKLPVRLKRLVNNNIPVLKQMYFTLEVPRPKKIMILSIIGLMFIGSLFVIRRDQIIQITGVFAFIFGAVFVPNMAASLNQWEYRYAVPVRSFFYILPMMAIIAAFWMKRDIFFGLIDRLRSNKPQ